MIAVDTNILARYLIKDDLEQARSARSLLAENRCYLLKSVLLELVWVLGSSAGYNLSRETVSERVLHLLGLACLETEDPAHVAQALDWYRAGMDFADALHLACSAELAGLATFDKRFESAAKKMDAFPPVILLP